EGKVEGSVFGFGQTVQARGQIARNLYAFGQTTEVAKDASIGENATMFSAQSDIDGTVGRDANVWARSLTVSQPARINGSLVARAARPGDVHIGPGVVVAGKTDVRIAESRPNPFATVSFYVWQIIWLCGAFLAGLVRFWLLPI